VKESLPAATFPASLDETPIDLDFGSLKHYCLDRKLNVSQGE
jgi:hypothetical protein